MYVVRDEKGAVCGAWTTAEVDSPRERYDNADRGDWRLEKYLNQTEFSRFVIGQFGLTIDDLRQAMVHTGVYVDRDGEGDICASHPTPQRTEHELLPVEAEEVRQFLAKDLKATKAKAGGA